MHLMTFHAYSALPCENHDDRRKIDVFQSRPSAGGHKILNFTSKILDFLTTGYLPFSDFFTFSQGYSYVFWIQYDYVFSNI